MPSLVIIYYLYKIHNITKVRMSRRRLSERIRFPENHCILIKKIVQCRHFKLLFYTHAMETKYKTDLLLRSEYCLSLFI